MLPQASRGVVSNSWASYEWSVVKALVMWMMLP